MELPITKPSKVSYADELEFSELLEQMSEKEYNGFIRITHGSEEGYILFKDGIQVAASYDRYLKNEALEKIMDTMDKSDTLIEVFDLRLSQVDYLIDLNRAYKLEPISTTETQPEPITKEEYSYEYSNNGEDYFNPKEASYRKSVDELRAEEDLAYEKRLAEEKAANSPEVEPVVEPEPVEPEVEVETISEPSPEVEPIIEKEVSEPVPEPEISKLETEMASEVSKEPETESKTVSSIDSKSEAEKETPLPTIEEPDEIETVSEVESELESEVNSTETETALDIEIPQDMDELEEEVSIPVDRLELMKKYGLKDIQEEEVDKMLETYKGGTVSSADLERIELTIMNRVKQSVMGIPKIKGVEVIVFLENARELGGKIKIIAEYEGKGLFSRIMGDSKAIDNLKFQILEIAEMEIRKSFREYPQIVENFDIGIEIH